MAKKTSAKRGRGPSRSRARKKTSPKRTVATVEAARPLPFGFSPPPGFELQPDGLGFSLFPNVTTTFLPNAAVSPDLLETRLSPIPVRPASDLKRLPLGLERGLDPRLQLAVANFRMGKTGPELASTAGDEVAVIARVNSVEAWEEMADVDPGVVLGTARDGKSWIVTGRVPIKRVEAVGRGEGVVALTASQTVQPSLAATTTAMEVAPSALPKTSAPDGGAGVVVGIVDFGCDFAHRNFRLKNGRTRLLSIWHQSGKTRPGSSVKYGSVYSRAEIDNALLEANPYLALGYGPRSDRGGTHGTHVMDIAVGNGNGTRVPGVAPNADIVFVEAAVTDIAWHGHATIDSSFGDSVQLLEAVRFIFDTAGNRPCVCNISLGTNGGPHDGSTLVEQALDAIVREAPNRAIVIAAGNAQADDIHTQGIIRKGETRVIEWRQQAAGGGEFELWYPGSRRLEVRLVAPDGTKFDPVAPNDYLAMGSDSQMAAFISSRLNDPNNGDNMIGIWIAEGLSEENFKVELRILDDVNEDLEYHAWIERDDRKQGSFVDAVATHTLGSISTGHDTLVVGSYDGHKKHFPNASTSSAGPTRDGREKPELSAPGQFVLAAMSGTRDGVVKKSGTSMAAPAVTGLVALLFAEARRQRKDISIEDLREKLIAEALVSPPNLKASEGWHPTYGYGRACGRSIKL
ncbi:S8 family serine peptidase [Bradyrhizobium sp. CB82]|uniref:S8 family serine peptidase n=1 Tax=Bradyrhizobium sp. CB82 TaxID=3039159 RepID=UPI0024B0A747|nr:S8 family serine peptidase [Bradyrhizobium sp. CB82]WFU42726.1 S8 family serine peptidase [Bradyrhizobium sp. CB82]